MLAAATLTLAAVAPTACTSGADGGGAAPALAYDTTNVLDVVLEDALRSRGLTVDAEDGQSLCTRMYVDLLGRRPVKDELEADCLGRDPTELIDELTGSEDYRWAQRRRWADRLQYSDAVVDPLAITELDALVDRLYRRELDYQSFVVETLTHRAFVGRFIGYGLEQTPAQAAFTAFLGRRATAPEARDVDELWRPWRPRYVESANDSNERHVSPLIDPFACEAGVHVCASTIFGSALIAFPRNGRAAMLELTDLTPQDWESLRVPGRLFASLPMVWEAAADELFLRYLGRDLGIELPAAREALAQALENSGGNYLEAERTVLKSIFYRQRARVLTADQPQYLSGPTKRMLPEVWLHSAAEFVGSDAGDCDFRAPSAAATERDRWFSETARAMGGCPGTREPGSPAVRARKSELGLDTAVAEDQAVVTLCYELDVPALIPAGVSRDATDAAALRATAAHVLERAYATPAEGAELDHLLASAAEQCADCDAEQLARDLCTAVIGGIDYVAY